MPFIGGCFSHLRVTEHAESYDSAHIDTSRVIRMSTVTKLRRAFENYASSLFSCLSKARPMLNGYICLLSSNAIKKGVITFIRAAKTGARY